MTPLTNYVIGAPRKILGSPLNLASPKFIFLLSYGGLGNDRILYFIFYRKILRNYRQH